MAGTKTCPDCGETKTIGEFGRDRSLGDGLSFYCLACSRARNRRLYRDRRRAEGHEIRDHSWIPTGFRWCPTCRRPKAHEAYTRNSRTPSGYGSQCKVCHNLASSAAYFYRTHRMTPDQVAELRAAQGDRCGICADAAPEHLDHDHRTGAIRQLLCQRCNQGLGLLRDDPDVLRAAAGYVERHRALLTPDDETASHHAARRRPASPATRSRGAGCSSHDQMRTRVAALVASLERTAPG